MSKKIERKIEKSKEQMAHAVTLLDEGKTKKAIHSFVDAFDSDPNQRAPFIRIAEHYRKLGSADHVIAYVASALQVAPSEETQEDPDYQNIPHELMYWALWEKEEYNASKRHFDQCLAYQPFNSQYLTDFKNYYELPTITLLHKTGNVTPPADINYPEDKILPDNSADWRIYIPDGYELESDSVMCAFKQALDNKKYYMAFNDGTEGSHLGFMIHKKLVEKVKNFDEIMGQENYSELVWEEMKKLNQHMVCGRAKIIKN